MFDQASCVFLLKTGLRCWIARPRLVFIAVRRGRVYKSYQLADESSDNLGILSIGAQSKITVVAVENDSGERELLQMAVDSAPVAVNLKVFEGGEEALRFLHDDTSDPLRMVALVILDFNTPAMSGDHMVERLRAHVKTRLTPVVMLSGSAREADLRSAYEKGANGYLQKPVDFLEFSQLIATTLQFWCVCNRPLAR
jgi:two-component system, response regulator